MRNRELTLDVLIPHYNDVAGVKLSLASIEAQDWKASPMRIVIADDGSDHGEFYRLERLIADSPLSITLIRGTQNKGRPFARNTLLDAIDSRFAAWLDAGDEWYPNKISSQFAAMHSEWEKDTDEPFWVTCNYDWKWLGRPAKLCRQQTDGDQVRSLLVGRHLRAYLWTILASSEHLKIVGRFDQQLPRLQDLDFFLRFACSGGRIVSALTNQSLCVYHKSDIGRDATQIRNCNSHLLTKHWPTYAHYGANFVKSRVYEMELLSARFAAKNADYRLATHYLLTAAKMKPASMVKRVLTKGLRL